MRIKLVLKQEKLKGIIGKRTAEGPGGTPGSLANRQGAYRSAAEETNGGITPRRSANLLRFNSTRLLLNFRKYLRPRRTTSRWFRNGRPRLEWAKWAASDPGGAPRNLTGPRGTPERQNNPPPQLLHFPPFLNFAYRISPLPLPIPYVGAVSKRWVFGLWPENCSRCEERWGRGSPMNLARP